MFVTKHRLITGSVAALVVVLAVVMHLHPTVLFGNARPLRPVSAMGAQDKGARAALATGADQRAPLLPAANAAPRPPAMPELSPAAAGMNPTVLARIDGLMNQAIADGLFPGGVVVVARDGAIVKRQAYGYAALYKHPGQRLANPEPATVDTIYDLASLTKLFTATAVMRLVETHAIALDAPVADYIPEFAANGKQHITVKNLLTHTGGLPAGIGDLSTTETPGEVLDRALTIAPQFPPNTRRLYSDVNFIVLGELVHRITGKPLDQYVAEEITGPLGLVDTMYRPPAALLPRIAPTEQLPPPRGMVRGVVHDPVAYQLGGVSGNAGLFSTASDLAVFAQMMLNGGEYGGRRILDPETVAEMTKLQVPAAFQDDVGLGWELNQSWYMGALNSPVTFGHTGYTGTSIVVDPPQRVSVVLLTNRVHPLANTNINATRRQLADIVAQALR